MLESNWHKVPDNLQDILPDRLARDVYEVLLVHSDKKGYCFPSIRRISMKARMSPSTVLKKLQLLEQLKFIKIHKEKGRHNVYEILPIKKMNFQTQQDYVHGLQFSTVINDSNKTITPITVEQLEQLIEKILTKKGEELLQKVLQPLFQNYNSNIEKTFKDIASKVFYELLQNYNGKTKEPLSSSNSFSFENNSSASSVTPLLYSEEQTVTPLLHSVEQNKKYNKTYLTIQEQDIINNKYIKEKKENLTKERKEKSTILVEKEDSSGNEIEFEKDWLPDKESNSGNEIIEETKKENRLEKDRLLQEEKEKKEKEKDITLSKEKERKENKPARTAKKSVPPCPHEQIIELYHEILPMLPRVRIWKGKRRQMLEARWKEAKQRQRLNWWKEYFEFVKESDFLTGKKTDFRADLEWLVGVENMAKVLNGRYHTKKREMTYEDYLEFERRVLGGSRVVDIKPEDVKVEDLDPPEVKKAVGSDFDDPFGFGVQINSLEDLEFTPEDFLDERRALEKLRFRRLVGLQ